MKQAVKKKDGVKTTVTSEERKEALRKFKKNNNLDNVKEKELSWYVLPEAFQTATRLPGIPKGYVSAIRGHSNTGKSTIKLEVIKAVINQGDVPVVFELENNFAWTHAREMGIEISEYVDEETGEIEYGPADNMLYYDTNKLFEIYGTFDHESGTYSKTAKRETYVIEDVALCIRDLVRKQKEGELPFNMVFIIDSIGVGDCYRAAVKQSSNNMWYANAVSVAFNAIVNDIIPGSRNVNSEYTNSMFVVNKVWVQTTATGLPSAKSKGGISLTYSYRLLFYVGGISGASVKALTATSGGKDYTFGTKAKITVEKNHVNNLTYTGEICSLPQGLWDPSKIDLYKKTYASYIKEKLAENNNMKVEDIQDISYNEVDVDE